MPVEIKVKNNPKIITRNEDGSENGFLIPIINIHEQFLDEKQWPKQVYCTVANPGEVKGPHLHKKRWQLYTCIKGDLKVVIRVDGKYIEKFSGDSYNYATIQVPAGTPSALVNIGECDAYIINMPSPAWHIDDQDDWDVSFDDYLF